MENITTFCNILRDHSFCYHFNKRRMCSLEGGGKGGTYVCYTNTLMVLILFQLYELQDIFCTSSQKTFTQRSKGLSVRQCGDID